MKKLSVLIMLALFLVIPSKAQDTISIVLNPSETGLEIPTDFAGISIEKIFLNLGYFSPNKDNLINLFQTLGVKSMRIGGNSADADTFSTTSAPHRFTKANIDSVFLFAKKANCKIFMGLNFGGDFNPSLAEQEVKYIMQNFASEFTGIEVGNEPDLYHENGFRPSTYSPQNYETQYLQYYDSIRYYSPAVLFTGPTTAGDWSTFVEPFYSRMKGILSMLTMHYYALPADVASVHEQINSLLSAGTMYWIKVEVKSLVTCADSTHIPFRMGESNSFSLEGQWGVSDAFVSSLWALDYMYTMAELGCAGINFHNNDACAVIMKQGNIYTPGNVYYARPIYYGILAFQVGSKGRFISSTVNNNHINLNCYSVIDSLKNIYVTVVNKDTLQDALMLLNAGDTKYTTAEYLELNAPSLGDTILGHTTLGGQAVNSNGTCGTFYWQTIALSGNKTQLLVKAGSAAIIRFSSITTGLKELKSDNRLLIYPNPANDKIYFDEAVFWNAELTIYTIDGKIVVKNNHLTDNSMDVSNLSPGIYFMEIENENFSTTQKIIIYR